MFILLSISAHVEEEPLPAGFETVYSYVAQLSQVGEETMKEGVKIYHHDSVRSISYIRWTVGTYLNTSPRSA